MEDRIEKRVLELVKLELEKSRKKEELVLDDKKLYERLQKRFEQSIIAGKFDGIIDNAVKAAVIGYSRDGYLSENINYDPLTDKLNKEFKKRAEEF